MGHYLDQRLAALRHEHNRQIEELRAKLAHLGDRGIRSNEKEFQAITLVWEHLMDAYAATMVCSLAYASHADLKKLSNDEVARYLVSFDLSEQQRKKVLEADDKTRL